MKRPPPPCASCRISSPQIPPEQDRLVDDIDRLMSTADDITYENMKKLTFIECVINESLQLYPPVTM